MKINMLALRQSIRTLTAGSFAIATAHYFPSPESFWTILAACLFVQIRAGDLLKQHVLFQLVAGLLAGLFVFIASSLGKDILFLSLFLMVTSFISVYIGFRWKQLFLAAYIVNLFAIMGGGMPVDFQMAALRRQHVITGMAIGMLVTFTSWPAYLRFAVKDTMKNCRTIFKKTLNLVFSIYLMHDYLPHYLEYEKKLYQLNREFFYWVQVMSRLNKKIKRKKLPVNKIERIYELIMALGLLRYRVKDHTTFEIIDQELKNILSALNERLSKPHFPSDLDENIDRLEEVYQGALNVAAQEPLVFLFFMQDLRALAKELEHGI